jgi:hypothetical protein
MRGCRHCSHENADHLGYCTRCGHRLMGPATEAASATAAADQPRRAGRSPLASMAALSRTVLATPPPARAGTRPLTVAVQPASAGADGANGAGGANTAPRSRAGWAGDSIGYIYVYLRGKLDAGERRRRLIEERDGAEALLAGAIKELGATVLREQVEHPDLTGLLEAIGRAAARRDAAAGDVAASENLQAAEEARLAAQEAALDADWKSCDGANHEADEGLRATMAERQAAGNRLARLRDERARLSREADAATATGSPDGAARAAHLRHEEQGLAAEQRALEEQIGLHDRQLGELRERSGGLRAAAAAARSKLDQAVAARRQAASAMAASIAGHARDRAEAEREVAELTEQLGRAAAETRPAASSLLSAYQRIARLRDTITDRNGQIAALDQAQSHYDQRKLLTGVGLVASMLLATAAALWVALK